MTAVDMVLIAGMAMDTWKKLKAIIKLGKFES